MFSLLFSISFFPFGSAKWKTTVKARLDNLGSRLDAVQEQQAVMIQCHDDVMMMEKQVFIHIML